MERIFEFLKTVGVFFVTSVDGDKPRVRPFGLMFMFEGKIYFGMGDHKASYSQLLANPNCEICACSADESWIRIKGRAVFDNRPEVHAAAFETSPRLKKVYNQETGYKLAAFYLDDIDAELQDLKGHFEKLM